MLVIFFSPSYRETTTSTFSGVTGDVSPRSCACAAPAPAAIAITIAAVRLRITVTPLLVDERDGGGHRRDDHRLDPQRGDGDAGWLADRAGAGQIHQDRHDLRPSSAQRLE